MSFCQFIMSSPRLAVLIQELEVRRYSSIQLPPLQQVLSDLPRLQSLSLSIVSLLGAPTPVKTPPRSLSLSCVATNDIALNAILGLFSGIECYTLFITDLTLLVLDLSDCLELRLQLKHLSIAVLGELSAMEEQYTRSLFRAIRNTVIPARVFECT